MQKHNSTLSDRLISGLQRIVDSKLALPLIPLGGNKQPLGDRWQNRPFTANELIEAIASGGVSVPLGGRSKKIQLQGYGLLSGRPITVEGNTYRIIAVDQDGPSAIDKIAELSEGNPLPKTVTFASGREGRCQYLFLVSEREQNSLKTKKIKTGAIGDDGKGEQLEFRWINLQSVLPPSVHPTTGSYHWIEGCAIDEVDIAIAPDWIVEQMSHPNRRTSSSDPLKYKKLFRPNTRERWTDIDYALSYLNSLSSFRADDYDQWLSVGMALHSVDDSLLDEWDRWSNQSAKYKAGDCERKWRSFSSGGGVKLGTLAYMAKQDGWQSPFTSYQQVSGQAKNKPKVNVGETKANKSKDDNHTDKTATRTQHANSEEHDEVKIRELLWSILQQNLEASAQTEAINDLSASWGWSVRELRTLLEQIETDLERKDNRSEHQQQLQQLATYKQSSLNLDLYLPESIAQPITKVANWMEAPTAAYLVVLLSAIASCCDPRTRIVVKESINFIEPAIIYGGIVTESGQRKSPVLNTILDGIKQLQAEEEERYQLAKADYDFEYQSWMKRKDTQTEAEWKDSEPTALKPLKEFFIDKTTIEAIDRIKGEQPDTAFLWIKDELSGLFSSYGAYKKGKGDDRESVLSSWNGRGIKKNLKGGERVFVPYDAMSIIGAVQDTTLQKLMGDLDDAQGEWGRFLWALIPLKALKLPRTDTKFQLAFLKSLYQNVRSVVPQQYRFDAEAQHLYDNFHWQLEQRRVVHPQPGMRAAISKMEGYTARLALVLHLIWELEAGHTTPSLLIPSARVEAAISLAEFFLSQVTLIHSEGCAAKGMGGLTPRLNAILNKLEQFGELTARKLQSATSWLRKEKPDKIRQDLIELANLGYGELVGTGNRLKLVLSVDRDVDRSVDPSCNPGTKSSSGIYPIDRPSVDRSIVDDSQVYNQATSGEGLGYRVSRTPEAEGSSTEADQRSQQRESAVLGVSPMSNFRKKAPSPVGGVPYGHQIICDSVVYEPRPKPRRGFQGAEAVFAHSPSPGDSPLGVGKNSPEDRFQANSAENDLETLNRSKIDREQYSKKDNGDRPIDSYDKNRESIGGSAIDNRSTHTSTVATVSQGTIRAKNENSTAINSDCTVTEIATPPKFQQSSEIVNKRANFNPGIGFGAGIANPLVLGIKVFSHLIGKALSINQDVAEPDLVTPIVEYRGYQTLATLLLRSPTPEALAVLCSKFPQVLLFESLSDRSNSREHLQRLKNLEIKDNTGSNVDDLNSLENDSKILSHQPIYVYWRELNNGSNIRNSNCNPGIRVSAGTADLKSGQYLERGTLVVALNRRNKNSEDRDTTELIENTTTMSSDDLTYVQILGQPNDRYLVKRHDLIQLC